jgi:hypothetical protein
MVREGPPQPAPYPAEQMRRDRMLRRLPMRRAVFIAAIAALALVLIVVLLAIWA